MFKKMFTLSMNTTSYAGRCRRIATPLAPCSPCPERVHAIGEQRERLQSGVGRRHRIATFPTPCSHGPERVHAIGEHPQFCAAGSCKEDPAGRAGVRILVLGGRGRCSFGRWCRCTKNLPQPQPQQNSEEKGGNRPKKRVDAPQKANHRPCPLVVVVRRGDVPRTRFALVWRAIQRTTLISIYLRCIPRIVVGVVRELHIKH